MGAPMEPGREGQPPQPQQAPQWQGPPPQWGAPAADQQWFPAPAAQAPPASPYGAAPYAAPGYPPPPPPAYAHHQPPTSFAFGRNVGSYVAMGASLAVMVLLVAAGVIVVAALPVIMLVNAFRGREPLRWAAACVSVPVLLLSFVIYASAR